MKTKTIKLKKKTLQQQVLELRTNMEIRLQALEKQMGMAMGEKGAWITALEDRIAYLERTMLELINKIMLAKIVLVLVMTLNGAYINFVLGPRMSPPGGPPGAPGPGGAGETARPPGPPPDMAAHQQRMLQLMAVQLVLAVVVILLSVL